MPSSVRYPGRLCSFKKQVFVMNHFDESPSTAGNTAPRILVDAFNLALPHGSGIKTYGITLLEAYHRLGFPVDILTAEPGVSGKSPLLDEVILFERRRDKYRGLMSHRWLQPLRDIWRLVSWPPVVEIAPRVTVPHPSDFLSRKKGELFQKLVNVPDIFHAANRLFSLVERPVRLRVPVSPDIWHRTTLLPIMVPGVKTITTIHDLIPLRLPFATLDNKKMFHKLVQWSVRHSDAIFTVSEHTKKDLVELYQVPENKVFVTYQACRFHRREENLNPEDDAAFLKSRRLEKDRFVLFLGNVEPKKNIKTLIRAMALLDPAYKLAIVGRKAWLWKDQLRELDGYLGKYRYEFLDYLPNDELSIMLRNATCLIFPSLYEGFGLPVLEAMNHGCPVICSNVSSLPEVGGDAVEYVDPYRHEDIRLALERVIYSPERRETMRALGYKQARRFSPENYDRRLQAAYEKILAG